MVANEGQKLGVLKTSLKIVLMGLLFHALKSTFLLFLKNAIIESQPEKQLKNIIHDAISPPNSSEVVFLLMRGCLQRTSTRYRISKPPPPLVLVRQNFQNHPPPRTSGFSNYYFYILFFPTIIFAYF